MDKDIMAIEIKDDKLFTEPCVYNGQRCVYDIYNKPCGQPAPCADKDKEVIFVNKA
jgi:hypothetical protein